MHRVALSAVAALALAACASGPNYASNEDLGAKPVSAFAETPAVSSTEDAADDPAIWVHPTDASKSLILGTDKQAGLHVYDLDGKALQFLPVGRVNNVDVRTVTTGGRTRHIAAASNRTGNVVSLFEIDARTRKVKPLGAMPITQTEPYGYCLGLDAQGRLMSFVTAKDGKVVVHRISTGDMRGEYITTWQFGGQLEGCVSDDDAQAVYIGEEEYGVWRVTHDMGLEIERVEIDSVAADRGLSIDVEGIDIWTGADGAGHVVVSSQGANRFVVYDRKAPYAIEGVFYLPETEDGAIDGVDTTDGLAVSSANLGDSLPAGLLVVQDNTNTAPDGNQNFKLIDWREIQSALSLD